MQKVVFHPPIPSQTGSLQANFHDFKLASQLSEARQNPASHPFVVGNALGVIDVPYKPGWIFIQRKMPDGTSIVSECYVPTNEQGQTKIQFIAGQIITPKKSSDTSPSYWIYEGIGPTPQTKLVSIANSFGAVYGNGHPNEDGTTSLDDKSLPTVLNVDHIYPYSAGVTSPISYKLTDSGQTDPATGQRLWKPTYTGLDFSATASTTTGGVVTPQLEQTGASAGAPSVPVTPQPPNDPALAALLNPCGNPDGLIPTGKLPLGNIPNGPVIKTRVPVDPNNRQPSNGFRPTTPPPKKPLPPGQIPQTGPDQPLPPPLHPPGPSTGPGLPPPSNGGSGSGGSGGSGSGGTGGTGGSSGLGGTWHDDGTNITGCFGVPICLDRQGLVTNDVSQPGDSTTLSRTYYNIRPQIDAAITKLIGDKYQPRDLIYVELLFDGIHQTDYPILPTGGATIATPFIKPVVYETNTGALPSPTDAAAYWDDPTVQTKNYVLLGDETAITASYQVYDFEPLTVGSPISPIACAPLHYSYKLTTLPAYSDDLLPLLADHPEYRLYLSCFMVAKEVTPPRSLPYDHNFAGGQDGWSGSYDPTSGGGIISIGFGDLGSPGPFHGTGWINGFTVTITGWSDHASDIFNNVNLANGVMDFYVYKGIPSVGNVLGHASKNMYPPLHTGSYPAAAFTWDFTTTLISPCDDIYFKVAGPVPSGLNIHSIKIEPTYGQAPAPPAAPSESGPATGVAGGSTSKDPINPGPGTIPARTPVSRQEPSTAGGADGSESPSLVAANAGAGVGGGVKVATGFAAGDIPPNSPGQVQTSGLLSGFTGLLPDKPVYLDPATAGGITQNRPSGSGNLEQQLGVAKSSTSIDINIGPATLLL